MPDWLFGCRYLWRFYIFDEFSMEFYWKFEKPSNFHQESSKELRNL